MGQDLSTIVRDLPVEFDLEAARLGDYDRETVIRLFREYEFRTLIERLPAMTGETAGDAAEALRGVATDGSVPAARVAGAARPSGWGPARAGPAADRRAAGSSSRSTSMPSRGRPRPRLADGRDGRRRRRPTRRRRPAARRRSSRPATCRPRWPPRSPTRRRIEVHAGDRIAALEPWLAAQPAVGVGLAPRRPAAAPRARRSRSPSPARTAGRSRSRAPTTRPRFGACSSGSATPVVGHEVKPLLVARIADDPGARPDAGRLRHPDRRLHPQRRRCAARRSPTSSPSSSTSILPPVAELDAAARAGLEALSALAVREPLERRLARGGPRPAVRARSSCRSSPVLARMEATGVALDLEALGAARRREFGAEISRLEAEIYADVGHEFNLGSPKQLEQVLFYELNLPKGKRTKTGYSTDASVLEDLRPAHPMIDKLLDWRIYTKLRSTYVEALPTLLAADGRLHTTFHQAVAATGRLSSSDPNLQNIPIRTPLGRRIRRAFVAGGAGPDARRRRLQPDRAADPRPRLGRRAPARRVRARGATSTARPPRSSSTRTRPT